MIQILQNNSTAITLVCSVSLIAICAVRLVQQWLKNRAVKKCLADYRREIESAEDASTLELSGPWGQQWGQFRNSLVGLDGDDNGRVWATQDPSNFFTVPGIQAALGLNLRAIASFPATLTGLGITCTFAGLVIGVTAAGNNLESAMSSESPNLLGMIEPLLSGAGVAFITSLVGLGLSIFYSNVSSFFTNKIHVLVNGWNQDLRSRWPVVNQSFIYAQTQSQQSSLMDELIDLTDSGQTAQVELLSEMKRSIADDLAKAMISALDQIRADRRQSDNSMVEEFSRCLSNMSGEFNTSIKSMVEQFHSTVRDMAGEEIDRFAGQLKELHSEYVSANEQLVTTNSDMLGKVLTHSSCTLEQTREITSQLSESTAGVAKYTDDLYTKFTHLQRDMQQWVFDTLEDSRNVIHSDLVAAGYSLKNNALEAGQLLISGADKASEQLDTAGGAVHQNLQVAIESLKESVELSGQRLTEQLSEAGDIVKSAGAQVSNDLAGTSEIVTAIHTDLQEKGVQLLQDMFEGAGYIFHDQVKQAGDELLIGSQKAVENFAACGASFSHEITEAGNALQDGMAHFVAAGDALKVNALEAGQLLINGAGKAGNELETAGGMVNQNLHAAIESLRGSVEESGQRLTDQLSEAGVVVKSAGAQISNDLTDASERISAAHTDLQEKGVQLLQKMFEGAGSTFHDQVAQAGNAAANEIIRGAQEVSEQQQIWTERHEKAVADLVHHVETSAANIHDIGKDVLGEWSVKVADASSALVMAAKDSSRLAESIEPVLEVQKDIANELINRTETLIQASNNSHKAQEQIVAGLDKVSESYQLLRSCIEDVKDSSADVEDRLRNLSEEFAAQYDTYYKRTSALTDGHSKRVNDLDMAVTNVMNNVNAGLINYGKEVNDFVAGLDKNASEILQTLSSAIDEMKALDDKKAADELRSLSALIREHEKTATRVELDMRQCPAYPGDNKVA